MIILTLVYLVFFLYLIRINLYQFEENIEEDSSFLKIGDVIWLTLSERDVYSHS